MDEPKLQIRQPDVFWRPVDNEIIALDGRTWAYLNLNDSARLLWEQLVEGATVAEMVEVLIKTYGIGRALAETDVNEFVDTLRARELLAE